MFIEELAAGLGKGEWMAQIVYPNGLMITGYKQIVEMTDDKIVLGLPQKKRLVVCGQSLSILTLAESEIYLKGKLKAIEVL